jgi:hypothetical protein
MSLRRRRLADPVQGRAARPCWCSGDALRRLPCRRPSVGGLRREPAAVRLVHLALALRGGARAGRVLHDADGLLEHPDSVDGARRAARARDGDLLDDVHGHGAVRCAAGRDPRGSHRCAGHGCERGGGLHPRRTRVRVAAAGAPVGSAAHHHRAARNPPSQATHALPRGQEAAAANAPRPDAPISNPSVFGPPCRIRSAKIGISTA